MDILDRFIAQAKENVESGYYALSGYGAGGVGNEHRAHGSKPLAQSLRSKLLSQPFSLIAEIKHASPAGEYSFDSIDVEKTAAIFQKNGADAISVVVEPKIFKGHLRNVTEAKRAGLPILFKDFVFCKEQINAAEAYGADCVLLVMKVVDRLGLEVKPLIQKAHALGLEVLLECYDADELQRAAKTPADILGINNRDLQTLEVDLNRTHAIMKGASDSVSKPVISESGIQTKKDAEFVRASGVRGILVGTALWKAEDQAEKIRELRLR